MQNQENKPTVLFAGIQSDLYDSRFMIEGFESKGYNVSFFDWQKGKYNGTIEEMQSALIARAYIDNPEFIFLHIQLEEVLTEQLCMELQIVAPTVIYNFDCRTKEQTQWLYELCPLVELICFSNLEDVQNCKKLGYENAVVLKSSADFKHYDYLKADIEKIRKEEYPHEIVFIGNRYDNTNLDFPRAAERTKMVEFLQKKYGDRFKAWGMGFSKMVNIQEEKVIYNCAKIAITHNNFDRVEYQSDRAYRAMGCGCFTIMNYYGGINKDFNSQSCSTWTNFEMLKEEIDKHLNNFELRFTKARAGYELVRKIHSWENRVNELLQILKIRK